jgi:hypothetical protein
MSLTTQSLKLSSEAALQLWRQLKHTSNPEEMEEIIASLWTQQASQEDATDACADLVDQIDAEMVAIQARMEHLIAIHQKARQRLQKWREQIDQSVIQLNENGIITNSVMGKQRRITIRENPPTCEVLIKPEDLPESYRIEKVKVTVTANKKAITDQWRKGQPIPEGTRVYRKRRVVYDLLSESSLSGLETRI